MLCYLVILILEICFMEIKVVVKMINLLGGLLQLCLRYGSGSKVNEY